MASPAVSRASCRCAGLSITSALIPAYGPPSGSNSPSRKRMLSACPAAASMSCSVSRPLPSAALIEVTVGPPLPSSIVKLSSPALIAAAFASGWVA